MFLKILDDRRIKLLSELNSLSFISRFCLGEGTALSLQLSLRKSYDFDFFTTEHFNPDVLLVEIKRKFGNRLQITNKESQLSALNVYIDDIQVSFFEYSFLNLNETIPVDGFANIKLFSINDIACMKAIAIDQRGTKKDFYDLYFILDKNKIDAEKLKSLLLAKYKKQNVLTSLCYSLSYFENAEDNALPESLVDYSWEEIKKYFIKFQKTFFKLLFN